MHSHLSPDMPPIVLLRMRERLADAHAPYPVQHGHEDGEHGGDEQRGNAQRGGSTSACPKKNAIAAMSSAMDMRPR
jgi:hypothetical protein